MADEVQQSREIQTTEQQIGGTTVQRQTVAERSSVPMTVVASRVVWYIVGFIVVLLALRMVLLLLSAQQGNAFVDFIYSFSAVFAAPFFGVFSYTPSYSGFTFEVSTLVAILVYVLVGWGLAKLLTIGSANPRV
ncbi:hypothetical protein KA093_01080 [Candidatus Saccharibacteria bacterium]|nr:hypothetical protein [Candidatus Saccharibacteria bacterium]